LKFFNRVVNLRKHRAFKNYRISSLTNTTIDKFYIIYLCDHSDNNKGTI